MEQSDQLLAPAAFLILFALATGDKHGYAIMQEARKLSDDSFKIGPATLYTTIQRLLDSDRIREVPGPKDGDSRRKYYRLTGAGKSALNAELVRMEAMLRKSKAIRLRLAEFSS
ncbi:MAG: PadR family transcriptional regulator [Bryobacteraceae bacterium]|jgi:DNA-binding PadR family transcriptional regulator